MRNFRDSPFVGDLEVIATLAEDAIHASLAEMQKTETLTAALVTAIKRGVTIDDLSDASGLTPRAIHRRLDTYMRSGAADDDLDELAGIR